MIHPDRERDRPFDDNLRAARKHLLRHADWVQREWRSVSSDSSSADRGAQIQADRLIAEGNRLEDHGDALRALALYRDAIEAAPAYARGYMNAGNALRRLERYDEAVIAQRRAVECAPESPRGRFNLAVALRDVGDPCGAERELRIALDLQPDLLEALLMLADLLDAYQSFAESEAIYRRAVSVAPEHAGAWLNFGMSRLEARQTDVAIEYFARAKALDPGLRDAASFPLFALNFRTDLDPDQIAAEHRRIGAAIQRAAGPSLRSWDNRPEPYRVLRVGYVSADFRHHPVALFLRPVLQNHDPRNVETVCYSNTIEPGDCADEFRKICALWKDVSAIDDDQLVAQIRADGIDVLVDLSGHTNGNRLTAFARHPAPVQVSWLGYLNTTGIPAIDYHLCDRHTDPEGETEHLYTEQLARMPNSQWCYEPWREIAGLGVLQAHVRSSIVFGSFNQYRKISDPCLALWCAILASVPEARLLVMDVRDSAIRRRLLDRISSRGVDPARVEVRGRVSISDYFGALASVDVALDTFPYNGATTTLDALFMGVPVVALRSPRPISRSCYSILKTLEADELIAHDEREYVALNTSLARDPLWRSQLRGSLRPRLLASPLMDAKAFVAALEAQYRTMWETWCTRQNGAPISAVPEARS